MKHFIGNNCYRCCCKTASYLSSCHRKSFIAISTLCWEESALAYRSFQWLNVLVDFSNACPMNLLLVRSHQAETIIAKRLIQGRTSVEPWIFNWGSRKIDAFAFSATLPTIYNGYFEEKERTSFACCEYWSLSYWFLCLRTNPNQSVFQLLV